MPMSTKSAPWPKWPSQWLKSLPNPYGELSEPAITLIETGSPPEPSEGSPAASTPPKGTVLRFQDFVERPLRSSSLSRPADKGRGRPTGEADVGGEIGRAHV